MSALRLSLIAFFAAVLVACGQPDSGQSKQAPATNEQAEAPAGEAAEPVTITVYSSRKEHLIKPLFDAYTEQTGVEIQYITDKAGPLMARLEAEGETTPADMLITVDAGNLWQAAQMGLFREVDSAALAERIPAHLRSTDNRWFGLSERARTIVYSTERVDPANLSTYEALADEQWQGRLCLRTSKKVYNQSLVASLIAAHGEEKTEAIVKGWVANLAAEPFSNDTKTIEAVLAGQCDVAIVNTYYFGRLQKENPDIAAAVFWPNQGEDERGVHVNVSGAGITTHAKQPEAALALLEWLAGAEAQADFAGLNLEFPVNPNVEADPLVAAWGEFREDELNVEVLGELQPQAVKLMDRAGYR